MSTTEFLASVLPSEGRYCITALKSGQRGMEQHFVDSIPEALTLADRLDRSNKNVYFALATFSSFENSREAANAVALKSLFLDLDVAPDNPKKYPTQEAAIQALRGFCKEMQLPKPTLVNSGGGVHVYWPLAQQLSVTDWQDMAARLKHACVAQGLLADPVVTADAARVLRVPATHNYKTTPARDVSILGELAPIVSDLSPFRFPQITPLPVVKKTSSRPPVEVNSVTALLASNSENSFKLILQRTLSGRGCAQLRRIVQLRTELDEPSWRAGLSIAAFCTDRAKAIHVISAGHPGYNAAETETKAAGIAGPYTCDSFNSINPGGCADCPHAGRIKSPIVLGREYVEGAVAETQPTTEGGGVKLLPEDEVEIPKYPAPYFRGKNGGVFKHDKDEAGDPKTTAVYHNDIYVVKRVLDADTGDGVVVRLHLPKDGVKEFTLPLSTITSTEEMRKALSTQGVGVLRVAELMAYMVTWVNELQSQIPADKARRQFGWTDMNGTSFVVGSREIFKDRIAHNPPSANTAHLFPYFDEAGTMDAWKGAMAFYNQPGMEIHQYMIGIGFGSPLLHMLPIHGAGFHVYSDGSGYGKTTGMLAGASIWGKPKKVVVEAKDTHNSKMLRAEVYRHIPLYIDELTNVLPRDLSELAYHITGGEQRNRMSTKGNAERHRGEEWALICGSTGNRSIWESLSAIKRGPQAEMQRILEMPAQKVDLDKKITDVLSHTLQHNYGHAKLPFLQYICANYDEVKRDLQTTQATIDHAAKLGPQNRFWSAEAACIVMGVRIAKRLKLIDWNITALMAWIVSTLNQAKKEVTVAKGSAVETLTTYYLENYNNILRVKSSVDGRVSGHTLETLAPPPNAEPRQRYVARYEYDVGFLYVVPTFLREWCAQKQIHYGGLISELEKGALNAKRLTTRLGKGTNVNLPVMNVLRFDFSDAHLEGSDVSDGG